MAGGGDCSNSSSTSRNFSMMSNQVCECGKFAVVRTVNSGPNVGFKFHGCPNWPNSNCNFFKWIQEKLEEKKQLDDDGSTELRRQFFGKETTLCQLEYEKQLVDEKKKKLQTKKENLELRIKELKLELRNTRSQLMEAARNEKILAMAVLFSWLIFAIVLYFVVPKVQ